MRNDSHGLSQVEANGKTPGPLPAGARQFIGRAARSRMPVLLEGETGTGKTTLAHWIHEASPWAAGPFVPVDCATLPEGLIERELFGHVRGAYTDARESGEGLVPTANGGTLFLDEIGELPLGVQPKLLALLEEGTVRRLGDARARRVKVRIITATNRNLEASIERGTFRADLYYRCRGMHYRLPPLRERSSELPALIEYLLERIISEDEVLGVPDGLKVSAEARAVLRAYAWPGNLRELRSVLAEAALAAEGGVIEAGHLPEEVRRGRSSRVARGIGGGVGEGGGRQGRYIAPEDPEEERRNIIDALRAARGKMGRAAARLGMSRHTLWERIRRYGIEPGEWAAGPG